MLHSSTPHPEARLSRYILMLAAVFMVACGSSEREPGDESAAEAGSVQSPPRVEGPVNETGSNPPAGPRADYFVALDGEGLRLVTVSGSTRLLPFGAATGEVAGALERIWGAPREEMELPDCGFEPPVLVSWEQGLNLLSVDGVFVGWSAMEDGAPGAPSTMAGLAVGVERGVAEAAYELDVVETTAGTEFQAGGILGVFEDASPAARVRSLWAGRACIYR